MTVSKFGEEGSAFEDEKLNRSKETTNAPDPVDLSRRLNSWVAGRL